MSCDWRRKRYFDLVAPAVGKTANVLEMIYQANRRKPVSPAEATMAEAKTLHLFAEMRRAGIMPPVHSKSGVPRQEARLGYAAVYDLLHPKPPTQKQKKIAAQVWNTIRDSDVYRTVEPALAALAARVGADNVVLVGGAVRDAVLGRPPSKDIDTEVYKISVDELIRILRAHARRVDLVGVSFGVVKAWIGDYEYDFSCPGRENKEASGHKGVKRAVDQSLTKEEAAGRRDFTWNAMGVTFAGEFLDFYGGRDDLLAGIMRHTSPAFKDDPLRVVRGMQFAARERLAYHPDTAGFCRGLLPEYRHLSSRRIWMEWEKMLDKGTHPSYGLMALRDCGWIATLPELAALDGCEQDPEFHPEGDTFVHTALTADEAVRIANEEGLSVDERRMLTLAAISHDLGKPKTLTNESGSWRTPGHAQKASKDYWACAQCGASAQRSSRPVCPDCGCAKQVRIPSMVEAFLTRIDAPRRYIPKIVAAVRHHMIHIDREQAFQENPREAVMMLADDLWPASIKLWALLVGADNSARPPLPKGNPVQAWLDEARRLGCENEPPPPLITGTTLLEIGVKPGPHMGQILAGVRRAQCAGTINTPAEALSFAHSRFGANINLLTGDDLKRLGVDPGPNMGQILRSSWTAQDAGLFHDREGALTWAKTHLHKMEASNV